MKNFIKKLKNFPKFYLFFIKIKYFKNLKMYYFNKIYIFNILIKTLNKNKLNIII